MRSVTLVVGAPCAGKSFWVAERMAPGDVVVDMNLLAMDAGSPTAHDHNARFFQLANEARKQLEYRVSNEPDITAWVVRTLPVPNDRRSAMRRLNATSLVVIDPGLEVCLQRSREMGRVPDVDAAIMKWYGIKYGARNYGVAWQGSLPPAKDPRQTADWRKVSKLVRSQGRTCGICGNPIDYRIRYPDPMSFSVDHIQPVTAGGAWFDLANLQAAHLGCNSAKGNRQSKAVHRTSEEY